MKGRKKKSKWRQLMRNLLKKSIPFVGVIIVTLGAVYYFQNYYNKSESLSNQDDIQIPASSVETETGILEGQLTHVGLEHDTIVSITIDNTSFRPFVVRVQPYPKNFESSALVSTSTTDKESQQNVIHYSFNQLGSMLTIYYDGTMQQFIDERVKAKE